MSELWLFVGALAVAYLVPGPDMILVLETGLVRGRAPALATAGGLAAARAAHVALAGLGLAALLRAAPWAFDVVRVAGAAYLVWLGVQVLRSPGFGAAMAAAGASGAVPEGGRTLFAPARRGLLTNLLNPKALLFCSVLLPQFVQPDGGPVAMQFALLGAVLVAVGLVFDAVYGLAGAGLGRWLAGRPLVQRLQRWLFASILVGFGLRLALAERPA